MYSTFTLWANAALARLLISHVFPVPAIPVTMTFSPCFKYSPVANSSISSRFNPRDLSYVKRSSDGNASLIPDSLYNRDLRFSSTHLGFV